MAVKGNQPSLHRQIKDQFRFGRQFPVVISQSESGIDRTYQASCLMPLWPVELKPLSSKGFKLTLTLSN